MKQKCFVCVWEVPQRVPTTYWREWYRGWRSIYVYGHEWFQPHLSGPDLPDNNCVLPEHKDDERCCDESATIDPKDEQPHFDGKFSHDTNDFIWGFNIHEACWQILRAACHPKEPDIYKLHQILMSFPRNFNATNWGHSYGDTITVFPTLNERKRGDEVYLQYTPTWSSLVRKDPLNSNRLKIDTALARCVKERKRRPTLGEGNLHSRRTDEPLDDFFTRLPSEIRERVLLYLSTPDVASVRSVYPFEVEACLTQRFYESRFFPSNEFGYLFEALQRKVPSGLFCDWMQLYGDFVHLETSDESSLANRRRVWQYVLPLASMLNAFSKLECSGEPQFTFWEPNYPDYGPWTDEIRSPIQEPTRAHYNGSRVLFAREIEIDYEVESVYVSFLDWFDDQWITGLRFVGCGRTKSLGYILRGKERKLQLENGAVALKKPVSLKLAVSARGFGAIAIHHSITSAASTEWIGDPTGHKIVELSSAGFQVLGAQFDGMKMLSLAIRESPTSSSGKAALGSRPLAFRP